MGQKNKEELANITNEIRQVVFVYNQSDKTVLLRDVKTGLQDNKYLEITSGITENDQIIIAPYGAIARLLSDKSKVEVVDKKVLFESKNKEKD